MQQEWAFLEILRILFYFNYSTKCQIFVAEKEIKVDAKKMIKY